MRAEQGELSQNTNRFLQLRKSMNRVTGFDIIKCLAIFAVCFYHGNVLDKNIAEPQGITSYLHYFLQSSLCICVPLFFMVNGAILLNRNLDVKRNVIRILKLMFLVYFWGVVLLFLLKYICNDSYSVKEFFHSVWYLKMHRINYLWFLKALISLYILFPLLKIVYDHDNKNIFLFFVAAIFVLSFGNSIINNLVQVFLYVINSERILTDNFNWFPTIRPYNNYFFSIVYFALGGFLFSRVADGKIKVSNWLLLALFILSQSALFGYGLLMTARIGEYYDVVWNGYDTIMGLVMTCSIFIALLNINYQDTKIVNILSFFGAHTFGIYIFHILFIRMIKPYLSVFDWSNNMIVNFVYIVFVMCLSIVVTLLFKRIPLCNQLLKI